MVEEAERMGWTCFEDAKVAMLAPAGLREEGQWSYTKRFVKDVLSTGSSEKRIEDHAFKYGVKNLLRNLPRSIREVFEMRRTKLDVTQTKKLGGIASVHVLSHAEDKIFPSSYQSIEDDTAEITNWTHRDTIVGDAIDEYLHEGSIDGWSVPVDMVSAGSETPEDRRLTYGGEHAEHNDEQFYPRRSAGAILDILSR